MYYWKNETSNIIQNAAQDDFGKLFTAFVQDHDLSFSAFQKCWNDLKIGHIFAACPNRVAYSHFIQSIFQAILSLFYEDIPTDFAICCNSLDPCYLWNLAIVYTLYSVFYSQPQPINTIRVSGDVWKGLFEAFESFKLMGKFGSQAVSMLWRLYEDNAFTFASYTGGISLERALQVMNENHKFERGGLSSKRISQPLSSNIEDDLYLENFVFLDDITLIDDKEYDSEPENDYQISSTGDETQFISSSDAFVQAEVESAADLTSPQAYVPEETHSMHSQAIDDDSIKQIIDYFNGPASKQSSNTTTVSRASNYSSASDMEDDSLQFRSSQQSLPDVGLLADSSLESVGKVDLRGLSVLEELEKQLRALAGPSEESTSTDAIDSLRGRRASGRKGWRSPPSKAAATKAKESLSVYSYSEVNTDVQGRKGGLEALEELERMTREALEQEGVGGEELAQLRESHSDSPPTRTRPRKRDRSHLSSSSSKQQRPPAPIPRDSPSTEEAASVDNYRRSSAQISFRSSSRSQRVVFSDVESPSNILSEGGEHRSGGVEGVGRGLSVLEELEKQLRDLAGPWEEYTNTDAIDSAAPSSASSVVRKRSVEVSTRKSQVDFATTASVQKVGRKTRTQSEGTGKKSPKTSATGVQGRKGGLEVLEELERMTREALEQEGVGVAERANFTIETSESSVLHGPKNRKSRVPSDRNEQRASLDAGDDVSPGSENILPVGYNERVRSERRLSGREKRPPRQYPIEIELQKELSKGGGRKSKAAATKAKANGSGIALPSSTFDAFNSLEPSFDGRSVLAELEAMIREVTDTASL